VQARPGTRTQPTASHAFDVRIVAFATSPRAVRGLCELFGVDPATAQRVLAHVPAVVRRGVPAAEAQRLAAALSELGAQVALDPRPGADAPRPPPPPPAAVPRRAPANDGGRHGLHVDSAELEFDMMSAFDAAMDTGAASPEELPLPAPVAQAEPEPFAANPLGDAAALRHGRRDDLELGEGAGAGALDIDTVHAAPAYARLEEPAAAPRERRAHPQRPAMKGADATARSRPPPLTRAAVVQRAAPVERSRAVPLLRLLGAIGVCVMCYWLDSSILFGDAGTLSVIAQGLALQQLVLGVRGLMR
jgi:hypothetical protein